MKRQKDVAMNMDVFEAWFEAAYPDVLRMPPLIRKSFKEVAKNAWVASLDRRQSPVPCPLDTDENIGS